MAAIKSWVAGAFLAGAVPMLQRIPRMDRCGVSGQGDEGVYGGLG